MALDRALSDALRARLGVVDDRQPILGTNAEMRALRRMLRLTCKQMAARVGCGEHAISAWEHETPVSPRKHHTRERLRRDFEEARALGALAAPAAPEKPRRERPPEGFLYACREHGPVRSRNCWVERLDGRERLWHNASKGHPCGEVMQGGLTHQAAVLNERHA